LVLVENSNKVSSFSLTLVENNLFSVSNCCIFVSLWKTM
jgi:hypothetical protein